MKKEQIAVDSLDHILALQLLVAWAGEALCEPKRLGWWRTDLVDEAGGGCLLTELLPRTHAWAALEAVRVAAIAADRQKRATMAQPDQVRTLFFWGFDIDEQLSDRLAHHKRFHAQAKPEDRLPFPYPLTGDSFAKAGLEAAIQTEYPEQVPYQVVPSGRQITEPCPVEVSLCASKLLGALVPLVDAYPMPFYAL